MKGRELEFVTNYEKQIEIAKRLESIRKKRKISRERLSTISGVSYGSIRRFESTGEISFTSFVKIALALQFYDDLDNLFKENKEYKSIEDVINDQED